MFALPQPLSEAWHPSVERMARDPWYQRVCVQVAVTLLASAFHLLPMEELPAELGELLNPNRLMVGTAQEAAPQAPKLQQEQMSPRECLAERPDRRLAQKHLQTLHSEVWQDDQDFIFLPFKRNKTEG